MKYFVYQIIDKLKKTLGIVQPLHNGLWRQGVSVPGVTPTLFFIRIQFIRILRLRFGANCFRKLENIRPLQKKIMSNETTSQEKQFNHIFRGSGE